MNLANYINLGMGMVFVLIAWLVFLFPNLINPYGSMKPERKALVDIDGLKRAMAFIFGVCAALLMLVSVLGFCRLVNEAFAANAMLVLVIGMIVALFWAMKRYNGFGRDASGRVGDSDLRKNRRRAVLVTLPLVALAVVILGFVLVHLERPAEITFGETGMVIHGMYGRTIGYGEIQSATVMDKVPDMKMRVSGSHTGTVDKGRFLNKEGEACLMFVRYNGGPYLELRTGSGLIYLNLDTPEATQALLQELSLRTNNEIWK